MEHREICGNPIADGTEGVILKMFVHCRIEKLLFLGRVVVTVVVDRV